MLTLMCCRFILMKTIGLSNESPILFLFIILRNVLEIRSTTSVYSDKIR
jgi:hypothetical protein